MADDDGGMDDLADATVERTNAAFQDEELRLLVRTSTNLDSLKISLTSCPNLDEIITIVQSAAQHNDDIADLRTKLQALGSAAQDSVKQLIAAARSLPMP